MSTAGGGRHTDGGLAGRVGLVLGAGRGIGAAVAEQLVAAGARTAVVARRRSDLAALAGRLSGRGGEVLPLCHDLTDPDQAAAAVQEAAAQLGPVSLLVNNAASVTPVGSLATVDLDEWQRTLQLNLLAPVAATRTALPAMLAAGYGRIVNISTGAAAGTGMPQGNAYSTSKAGLEMHTLNLAAELGGSGVAVCAVRPGRVDTDMQVLLRSEATASRGAQTSARARAFLVDGDLLDPWIPATLVMRVLTAGLSGVVSVYDDRGRGLLHDVRYPGDGREP